MKRIVVLLVVMMVGTSLESMELCCYRRPAVESNAGFVSVKVFESTRKHPEIKMSRDGRQSLRPCSVSGKDLVIYGAVGCLDCFAKWYVAKHCCWCVVACL